MLADADQSIFSPIIIRSLVLVFFSVAPNENKDENIICVFVLEFSDYRPTILIT